MVTATVNRNRNVVVHLNQSDGVLQKTSFPVTVTSQITPNTIGELTDVEENTPESGDTLIYNAATDKYEVRAMDLGDLSLDVDGGEY